MAKTNDKPSKINLLIEKYVDATKAPFFLVWLHEQYLEILKAELKVKRKGLPKTGPRPMARNKQLLALLKTIEKLTLKDFAKHTGVSYGVVRLWNREPQVEEKTKEFMMLFGLDYLQKLKKYLSSKKLDFEKYSLKTANEAQILLNGHLNEVKHYHTFIQYFIISLMENEMDALPVGQSFMFKATFLYLLRTLSDWTIFNPPKDKKSKELFEQNIKRRGEVLLNIQKAIFSGLKNMIKNGETKKALKFCDVIEEQTLDIIKSNTDLDIRILNKGRQKRKDKSEKTVKSNKQKPGTSTL